MENINNVIKNVTCISLVEEKSSYHLFSVEMFLVSNQGKKKIIDIFIVSIIHSLDPECIFKLESYVKHHTKKYLSGC